MQISCFCALFIHPGSYDDFLILSRKLIIKKSWGSVVNISVTIRSNEKHCVPLRIISNWSSQEII